MDNRLLSNAVTVVEKKVSNKIRVKKFFALLFLAAVFSLGAANNFAYAADLTWDGDAAPDNNFSTAANWVGDVAPIADDNVTFNAGAINCTLDAFNLDQGDFTVTAGYSGTFSSSGTFLCDAVTLDLTNAAWSISNEFYPGRTDNGALTITAGTFTTSNAMQCNGDIALSGTGTINQSASYTAMIGTASKTITNTGGGTITFHKFMESSDTNHGQADPHPDAKTTINADITVNNWCDINGWAVAGDGQLILAANKTITVANSGFNNQGSFSANSGSLVKVDDHIYLNSSHAWEFSNSGTFEWTGSATKQLRGNSDNSLNHFNDFTMSGLAELQAYWEGGAIIIDGNYLQSNGTFLVDYSGFTISGTTTITDGILRFLKNGTLTGSVIIGSPGGTGELELKASSENLTLTIDTSITTTNSGFIDVDWTDGVNTATIDGVNGDETISGNDFDIGTNGQVLYLSDIDCQISTVTLGSNEHIRLSGDCTFDAITLNGDANTEFTTNDNKAACSGGTLTVTSGVVTISDGGEIDAAGQNVSTAANGAITLVGNSTLKAVNITNAGTINLDHNSNVIDITGNIDNDNAIDVAGTSANIYLEGNWDNTGGAFTCGSSTVTFDGSAAGQTLTSDTETYSIITVSNSHADGVIFADAFAAAALNDTTASSKLTFNAGDTYTITGAAGLNLDGGAAGSEITIISDLAGTQFIFNVTGGDQTVTYVNVKDSAASGNDITANTSINSGGNDDGTGTPEWTFGAVTRYWVGAANGDWDDNTNWSSTSGGASGADYPSAGDTAIFDGSDVDNCVLDANVSIAVIELQGAADPNGAYTGKLDANAFDITATSTVDITSGELELDANSDLETGGILAVDGGALDGASGTINTNSNVAISAGTLTAPSGNLNVAANWAHTGGIFTHSDGTVVFDDNAQTSVVSGNTTFYDFTCTTTGKQINLTVGTTQTVNNTLTLTGGSGAGEKITLRSTADGNKWDITLPSGAQTVSYVDVKDSDANTNTVTCYSSTNEGNNNANWVFENLSITTPEAGKTIGQQPTIRGQAGAGDIVTIKGTVGAAAYQTAAQVTADANGNYIVQQSDYSATLDVGANNIRADIGATLGAPVNVTVSAAPTTNQVPAITSPVDGGKANGATPNLSGSGLAGRNVTLSAWDADGNLLLADIATAVTGTDGTWSIAGSSYTASLVKGTNYLVVTVDGVTSDVISLTFTDPFGIVFDSTTNEPIANAIVTIYNQNGTLCVPGVDISGGDFNPQTTAADGFYSFLCANGNFYITVEAPGYTYPSGKTTLPTGRVMVTGSRGELFTVAGVIIEMDHPLDSNDLLLKIKKEANKKEAVIGDIVTYTVTIKNIGSTNVTHVFLEDRIPGGFKYITGKAILDNIPTSPKGSTALLFDIGTVNAQTTRTLKYQLIVGSGVTFGNYENTAWARYSDETVISNKDHATVKITPDPLFDLGNIIGKVFWDKEMSGIGHPTSDKAGLAHIQIVMEDGTIVTTDKDGKYHIPALTPGRHLLRIDERTLPEGTQLTTDKVIVIDVTPGILTKVNFGVEEPRAKSQEPSQNVEERETGQLAHPLTREPANLFFIAMGDAKAGYTFHRGHIEPIRQSDKFREGFWSEGKLAYYLKGKVLGKFLITSSLDTDRKQKELFRNLDPDKYYPVYGDGSTLDYKATDTQGALYLLVEWDKSSLMWGNYHIDFSDTDIASFKRTLYGAKLDYKTVSTTKFDQPNTKLIFFKARAQQQAAHVEFLGTGGSLFYLKHKYVIEGSEKITIEVRDKITGLTLASLEQEEGFDYEIDYDNGRIIFWEPVSHMVESDMIISAYLLGGNPVYVTADYEYETLDKYDRGIYGARVEQALGDYLSVGGTYVKEEQVDNNYELTGTDTTLRLGDKTKITVEYAESRSEELGRFISTDGGLSFTELSTADDAKGKAYGIKATSTLTDGLSIEAYYKKIEEGFSSRSTASEQGKELTGGRLTYDITDKTRITLRHDTQELIDGGNLQTQLQTGADKTQTTTAQITHKLEKLKLTGEYRHQGVHSPQSTVHSQTNEEGDTVALKADYKLNEKVILSLEQQAAVKGSANHQTTAGIRTRINEKLTLRAKQALGTKGAATSLGAGYNLTDKLEVLGDYAIGGFGSSTTDNSFSLTTRAKGDNHDEIYHTYTMSNDAIEGKKYSSLIGTKKTLESGLEFTIEEEESLLSTEKTNTNIFGVSGDINDRTAGFIKFERGEIQNHDGTQTKRNAISSGASYVDKDWIKASTKLELRVDKGDSNRRQYLSYNAAELKANDDTTLFAKINLSQSDNTTHDIEEGMYKEFIAGAAYRPIYNDRLNLLARYTYLEDNSPSSQDGYKDIDEEKSHIVAVEAVYDLTGNWQLVQKLALKMGEEKVTGFDFTETQTWLNITRLNYRINHDWKVGGEYRLLTQKQADDYKQGALLEVSRSIGNFIEMGAGYNFTDFNDDLTHLDYTSHGPFIRITGMMYDRSDEEREQARQKALEKNIKEWAWQRANERAGSDEEIKSIYEKFTLAQKLEKEGRLKEAKALYKEAAQRARVVYIEEEEYVKDRVRFEQELKEQRELAERYFEEGRLEEAKQLWRGIVDNF